MMSLLVYAGAAQLVVLGMLASHSGLGAILATTLLISARHLLYSMSLRSHVQHLPGRWRLTLGFLLTDELFALTSTQSPAQFNRWQALGAGLCLYLGWNLATAVGILATHQLPDLSTLGLEFAIAATFIALLVPGIRNPSTLCAVVTALLTSLLCGLYQVESGLLLAALLGMAAGVMSARWLDKPQALQEEHGEQAV